jgi:predicted dehydrogenase
VAAASSIRAAVVGAGLMGRWHAHAIRHAGGRVAAIVDADLRRGEALAQRLPGKPVVVRDIGYLLSKHPVDIVHVCTPVESHEAVTGAALLAGAHVLVEKPLAPDCATVEMLHARATEQGVLLCPVHQFLFQPGVLSAAEWLGELGPIRHFELVACSAGAGQGSSEARERVALDILPHGLALARRLLGSAWLESGWYTAPGEAGEIRASTACGSTSISMTVSMRARPTENSLTIRCDGGTVRANLYHGYASLERGTVSRFDKLARPFAGAALVLGAASENLARRVLRAESAYPGLRELVARFYQATTGACAPPIGAAESIDVARARDRLVGARVVVEFTTNVAADRLRR